MQAIVLRDSAHDWGRLSPLSTTFGHSTPERPTPLCDPMYDKQVLEANLPVVTPHAIDDLARHLQQARWRRPPGEVALCLDGWHPRKSVG